MIAVISRFYAKTARIDMTDFFGFAMLWHFNPLNASKMLEFSKTIQSFRLVVVDVVCNVIFLCNAASSSSDLQYSLTCTTGHIGCVCGLSFPADVFVCCVFYNI